MSVPVGSSTHSIVVGGLTRSYIVYRPAVLPALLAAPLVVMLHGGFGSASQAEKSYGWDGEADADHFLVVYPNGLNRAWNAGGGCCGTPAKHGIDDVGFITAVVAAVSRAVHVDAGRVYATGISNGGIMAYDLACHTASLRRHRAGLGHLARSQLASARTPRAVSVIAIHGTADKNIPYDGGGGDGFAHIDGPSVPAVNALWRHADDCAAPAVAHPGDRDHVGGALPGGAGGGADHHRRRRATSGRGGLQAGRAEAAWPRPAVDRAERDRGHLAVLRRAYR